MVHGGVGSGVVELRVERSVEADNWHFLAAVFDAAAGGARSPENCSPTSAELADLGAGEARVVDRPLSLACTSRRSPRHWAAKLVPTSRCHDGKIDSSRLYARVLTDAELAKAGRFGHHRDDRALLDARDFSKEVTSRAVTNLLRAACHSHVLQRPTSSAPEQN